MKIAVILISFMILGCSKKYVTPSDVKQAEEACVKNSTWKSIEVNGKKLWVVCVDDVPMNVERAYSPDGKKEGAHEEHK